MEHTKRGALAAKLREKEKQLCSITGWKRKVVEKSGTTLRQLLLKSNSWSGPKCGRKDCFPCKSTEKGNSKCFKKNILYETQCKICQKGEKETIYVGESSRTGYERGGEHWKAGEDRTEESHMWAHTSQTHPGENPNFSFKVVKTFQSALSRQVSEPVRITTRQESKDTEILNIKGTFNRCSLPSLVIQQYDKILVQKEREKEESIEEEESFMRTSSLGEKRRAEEKHKEEQPRQKPRKGGDGVAATGMERSGDNKVSPRVSLLSYIMEEKAARKTRRKSSNRQQ